MSLILRAVAATDLGRGRENNEDTFHAGKRLIAVADGMGGLPAGEVASEIAIRVLSRLESLPPERPALDALRETVAEANREIGAAVAADPALEGMGTTITAMLAQGDRIALAHVGDSRAYAWRDGELIQLTKDDTYVQALVDKGAISPEQASLHPHRSLVTKAVQGGDVIPAYTVLTPHDGDRYLLCSDGLTDVVGAAAIGAVLREHADAQECAARLIELALDAGGPDNITAVIADVAQE
jgi:protein phosphatase